MLARSTPVGFLIVSQFGTSADHLLSRQRREKARCGREFLHRHGNRRLRVEASARFDRRRWEGARSL